MLLGQLPGHAAEPQRTQREAFALKAADDLADQAALYAVRLNLRAMRRAPGDCQAAMWVNVLYLQVQSCPAYGAGTRYLTARKQ